MVDFVGGISVFIYLFFLGKSDIEIPNGQSIPIGRGIPFALKKSVEFVSFPIKFLMRFGSTTRFGANFTSTFHPNHSSNLFFHFI